MSIEKKSTAILINKNKKSLKTTIPSLIRDMLEIQAGDKLIWKIDVENEKISAKITKEE